MDNMNWWEFRHVGQLKCHLCLGPRELEDFINGPEGETVVAVTYLGPFPPDYPGGGPYRIPGWLVVTR